MKRWLAVAALAVLSSANVTCSRERDPSSGIRDPKEALSEDSGRASRDAGGMPNADSSIGGRDHAATHVPEHGTSNPATSNDGSRLPDPGSREIVLAPDVIERAGIKIVAARKGSAATRLHVPGVVQPNAYKNLDVTSLVAGRVTQVRAELGQRVMQNEVLATVYSPELADAQTAFIAARSQLAAHDLALARTQRLFAIGAASRQELEKMDAEKADMTRAVETARSRLTLLGVPEDKAQRIATPADVVTTFDVKSPIAGVITKRGVNPGLNIDLVTPLFTVTDLSTVWIVADLYERDFASAGVGSPVAITTTAYPGLELRGRVNYIDPQVQAETRTAKLRAEVANRGDRLRLGMFVDVSIVVRSAKPVVMVPKTAVQMMGPQSVVFVSMGGGRFVRREVTPGDANGQETAISSGLDAGEPVVAEGAFFLRAEGERLR